MDVQPVDSGVPMGTVRNFGQTEMMCPGICSSAVPSLCQDLKWAEIGAPKLRSFSHTQERPTEAMESHSRSALNFGMPCFIPAGWAKKMVKG